jgi:hypothetical protein
MNDHSLAPSVYIGIDNGFTGAVAALVPGKVPIYFPAAFDNAGKDKDLNIDANLNTLNQILDYAECGKGNVLAAVERCHANPKFGARNNLLNGKNNEFWRVLLGSHGFSFRWVNSKMWQKHVFAGMCGTNTTALASSALRQLFPSVSLSRYTVPQREGITDALLIALWAAQTFRWIPTQGPLVPTGSVDCNAAFDERSSIGNKGKI